MASEQINELLSIKKELKGWESMFTRKYGRKPTKEDIDGSLPEIQDTYKHYAKLKEKMKQREDCDTTTHAKDECQLDYGVFGRNLNKVNTKPVVKKLRHLKYDQTLSWRPKLKPIKRCSKVASNDENKECVATCNNENEIPEQHENLTGGNISKDLIRSHSPMKGNTSKSASQRRVSLFNKFPALSQDFIDNCVKSLSTNQKSNSIVHHDGMDKFREVQGKCSEGNNTPLNLPEDIVTLTQKRITYTVEELGQNKYLEDFKQDTTINKQEILPACGVYSQHNDGEKSKINIVKKSSVSSDEIVSNNFNDTKLDSSNPELKNSNDVVKKKHKTTTKRKRVNDICEDGEASKKVKITKTAASKSKRLVSDNFVKIDIRKKTYVRGLKKLTGANYKRKMWKQKTSFELPTKSASSKKCFKCGGDGHWAKFCRGKPKKVDPFLKLDEEKSSMEFQHLQENTGSCFDFMAINENSNIVSKEKNFSLQDVLDIKPCWPRIPYKADIPGLNFEPLYVPDVDSPSPDAYKKVKETLKLFGHDAFREGQHEATARIVSGLSTLVILSTGSGKSLCYQLPAYLYFKERGFMTIVVSPLVALMQDQISGLPSCLPGAFLNSNMTKLQQQKVVTKVKEGKVAVLLVSPEALVSGGFSTGILPPKSTLPPIGFACIDEAHCLSEWSHNFRPSYLKVCKVLRERYNISCLLGLTATASQTTAKSVTQHLGIPTDGAIIRARNPIPENLQITASRDDDRDVALVEILQMSPFQECESIIVYVTRRTEADRLAVLLRTSLPDRPAMKTEEKVAEKKARRGRAKKSSKPHWWNVESYHAGLTPAQRRRVQNQFMSGELRVVIATVAFGMGLDKSDVRSVIHFNMPKSFENYVQEIGRAGRDGQPSFCHVFLDDDGNDLNELRRHIYGNTVDRETINTFVDLFFPPCGCRKLNEMNILHNTKVQNTHSGIGIPLENDVTFDEAEDHAFFDTEINQVMNTGQRAGKIMESDLAITSNEKSKFDNKIDFVQTDSEVNSTCDDNYCSGHRIAVPIESAIQSLDMPEENIMTLLSYLELHPQNWLEILNPIRSTCSVKCYGGPYQFQLLARKFPPVALAIRAMKKDQLRHLTDMRQIEFGMTEIADLMCWDVMTVAREVRSLPWNMSFAVDAPLNTTGKSGIIVEFENLSFHVITAQNIKEMEKDQICDFLYENVLKQEKTRLLQINALYNVFEDISCKHYWQIEGGKRVDERAREDISQYFMSDERQQIDILQKLCVKDTDIQTPPRRWNMIASDIRNLLVSHPDQTFSGRAIAKILQGIGSPCYPALVYGRDKRFWRQCLDVDFNEIRKFAVKEISSFRS